MSFGLVPVGSFDLMRVFPVFDRWLTSVVVSCLDELFLEPERFEVYSGVEDSNLPAQGANGADNAAADVDAGAAVVVVGGLERRLKRQML